MSGPQNRRSFIKRAGLGAAATALSAAAIAPDASGRRSAGQINGSLEADGPLQLPTVADPAAVMAAVPFHGAHQAGITTTRPPAACFISYDVVAANRNELIELLHVLTHQARFLTGGGTPPNLGPDSPPSDSGTLGSRVPADGLTVTVSVGASLFDHRYGIGERRPRRLVPMRAFPNDDLDPVQTGGDLLLQICAGSTDTAIHTLREINAATSGALQPNWRVDGFASPSRPSGVPRDHFAFKDGIANPDVGDEGVANRLLWVTDGIGEPAWAVGGSYHVIRIIRQLIEFWDRVSIKEQQEMIGRFRGSGAPLDGQDENDIPDYAADPQGNVIPLTAHMRLANPRTTVSEQSRIYRRGYNYDRGLDINGNLDMGLVFNCFQQDLERQFVATQTRLIGEPMVDYVSPVGGGYFYALAGVRSRSDWYASGLFS